MSKEFFDVNHLLITSEQEVKEICKPMFELFNLQYFSYGKFFNDGRCVLLCTNKDVFVNHFQKKYKLTVLPKEAYTPKNRIYNLIMVNNDSPSIIMDEHKLFNHGTMLDIIVKSKGYYEMFCFVTNDISAKPINTFLNSLDSLNDFAEDFIKQNQSVLQQAERQLIQLPDSMLPNLNKCKEPEFDYQVSFKGKHFLLSERQHQCLAMLGKGKSAKEIAKALKISFRTVETHIDNLKIKLDCNRKHDLTLVALKNDLEK